MKITSEVLAQVDEALREIETRTRALDARASELQEEAARQKTARADLDAGGTPYSP